MSPVYMNPSREQEQEAKAASDSATNDNDNAAGTRTTHLVEDDEDDDNANVDDDMLKEDGAWLLDLDDQQLSRNSNEEQARRLDNAGDNPTNLVPFVRQVWNETASWSTPTTPAAATPTTRNRDETEEGAADVPTPMGPHQQHKRVPVRSMTPTTIRQVQRRLFLLHHGGTCTAGPACPMRLCQRSIELWQHVSECNHNHSPNSGGGCPEPHCRSSRIVLAHFAQCCRKWMNGSDVECEICTPFLRRFGNGGAVVDRSNMDS